MGRLAEVLKKLLKDVVLFCRYASGLKLRSYQEEVARTVIKSVLQGSGLSIVVMFPRQSGKNELQAQLEAYLLTVLSGTQAEMVKISPTYQPQCLNAMRRLERVLERNILTRGRWQKRAGNLYRYKSVSLTFLSGAKGANIVGATASTLLQVDEAQDVRIEKYDKEIAPMAASTNATRVFWGTAWTSQTLLARELRAAKAAQAQDGVRRVFVLSADEVCREVPAYGKFVAEQAARLGRNHPLIRTQFYSEEIDAEGGLFPAERQSLMRGMHPAQEAPQAGHVYAFLLDIAGEDEAVRDLHSESLMNPGRDASALTIVDVDISGMTDALIRKPIYRVVKRCLWVGERYAVLYARIKALAELWRVRCLVVDASGVGAGLASFLEDALGERVKPVLFNAAVKSKLGWGFLAIIDSGRFKDYASPEGDQSAASQLQRLFFKQLEHTQYEIVAGPEKRIKWGVPQGARDPASAELLHDDLVLSAALVSVLDEQSWSMAGGAFYVPASDPLSEMDRGF